jgi:tripartite-type tricarboxylate transporter receptor subunit TctC
MKLPHRRQFLHLAAGAAALPPMSRTARAQAYPSRPVRIIAPFAPGGPTDIIARLMGQWLSERLGQPFVIENRTGAGGNIGTEAVVRAPPDGYTLLMVGSDTGATNATLYDKLNFNFIRDIAPVAGIIVVPLIIVVNPAVASGGVGSTPHVAGELFKMMAGVNLVHVPYRGGGPARTDLLGGQVQVMFPAPIETISYIKAGKLRAVTTSTRWEGLPDIPTVSEFVPGYQASAWWGIGAPRNTPVEIIEKLNKEINAALADPKIKAQLADLGGTTLGGSPGDFGKLIADETEKWAKVIREANIKAE